MFHKNNVLHFLAISTNCNTPIISYIINERYPRVEMPIKLYQKEKQFNIRTKNLYFLNWDIHNNKKCKRFTQWASTKTFSYLLYILQIRTLWNINRKKNREHFILNVNNWLKLKLLEILIDTKIYDCSNTNNVSYLLQWWRLQC